MADMRVCFFCGAEVDEKLEIHRSTVCESCGKDLRICRNCAFYSPGSHLDCRETISEPVHDKERSNFCDYFRFGGGSSDGSGKKKSNDARERLDSLFGD